MMNEPTRFKPNKLKNHSKHFSLKVHQLFYFFACIQIVMNIILRISILVYSIQVEALLDGSTLIGVIDSATSQASKITSKPSSKPSSIPSFIPSARPSRSPSSSPSISPSTIPSVYPTITPSSVPSEFPTISPSTSPTVSQTFVPSSSPTISPSTIPTVSSSTEPSSTPSLNESSLPSFIPTGVKGTPKSISGNSAEAPFQTPPNKREYDMFFVVILSASVAAGVLIIGASLLVYFNHRRRKNKVLSNKTYRPDDDNLPTREPEPLPTTREFRKQMYGQQHYHSQSNLSYDDAESEVDVMSAWDPSTIHTEKTSKWNQRIQNDMMSNSYESESRRSGFSEFVLPSVFDPSTIRSNERSRVYNGNSQNRRSLDDDSFFNDEPIPEQIFC